MTEPLNLTGDDEPEREQGEPPKKKRPRGGDEPRGARSRRRNEGELRERLGRVFDRLVEWLEGRGDQELADAIREDAGAMTGGLVSLTKPIAQLRGPLLVLLAFAEPLLAFGRVGRIIGRRLADRRARRGDERTKQREQIRNEWQAIALDESRSFDEREEAARQVATIDAELAAG